MLRITIHKDPGSLTFKLEGRLAGPWVRELEACWRSNLASQRKRVLRFDLTGLTYVDAAGKQFLAARHTDGAEFLACGCLMRAVVAEITDAPVPDCGRLEGGSQT
jgi:anti-anti-sigma regulatory factor